MLAAFLSLEVHVFPFVPVCVLLSCSCRDTSLCRLGLTQTTSFYLITSLKMLSLGGLGKGELLIKGYEVSVRLEE